MNTKYKSIIFDMGGVLVNWNPREIIMQVFKNKSTRSLKEWVEIFNTEDFLNLDRGLISRSEAAALLSAKYNKSDFFYLMSNLHKYLFPLEEGLKLFDLVKNKNYNTYVLSNFGRETFDEAKHQYDFLEKVDGKLFSFEAKSVKPEPKIYKTLLHDYDLNPHECLFIDDMPINIDGAQKCGIDGIVCKDHGYVADKMKSLGVI